MVFFILMEWPPEFHTISMNLLGVLLSGFCRAGTIVMIGCAIEKKAFSSISSNVLVCILSG